MATHLASGAPVMTYARARLYLGASAVGTLSVLAVIALVVDLPAALPSEALAPSLELAWLALLLAVHAAVLAPFDLFAGHLVPREYGRTHEPLTAFVRRWLRGALAYALLLGLAAFALMLASRALGSMGSVLVLAFVTGLFLHAQPWFARLVGSGRISLPLAADPASDLGMRTRVLETSHAHVTGGAYGLPGRTGWVLPSHWLHAAERVDLPLQVARRGALTRSGARDRGVLLALAWTAAPLLLHLALMGPISALADVARLALWATLWSFVGVLVLPTPSRRAVFQADAAALDAGFERARLAAALTALEADQDDELERSRGVETIFHPIPSASRRIGAASDPRAATKSGWTTWHAARTALFLSVAGLGLLGRAVHCNLGRPEAWVFLPSD